MAGQLPQFQAQNLAQKLRQMSPLSNGVRVEGGTAIGQEEEGDEDEEGYFDGLIGKRGADLSGQTLKGDHALRSLWVNDRGNMWVFWIRRN